MDSSSKCPKFSYLHRKPEHCFRFQFLMCADLKTSYRSGKFTSGHYTYIDSVYIFRHHPCSFFTIFFSPAINHIQSLFYTGVYLLRYQIPKSNLFSPTFVPSGDTGCTLLTSNTPPLNTTLRLLVLSICLSFWFAS